MRLVSSTFIYWSFSPLSWLLARSYSLGQQIWSPRYYLILCLRFFFKETAWEIWFLLFICQEKMRKLGQVISWRCGKQGRQPFRLFSPSPSHSHSPSPPPRVAWALIEGVKGSFQSSLQEISRDVRLGSVGKEGRLQTANIMAEKRKT